MVNPHRMLCANQQAIAQCWRFVERRELVVLDWCDDVIMPNETRKRICRSLAMLRDKKLDNPWRKHGNIPL